MKHVQLTLASKSPRRAELLRQIGICFEIRPSRIVEKRLQDETPEAYVCRLAQAKAAAVQHDSLPSLGSDTIVVHRNKVLEKPRDRDEGIWMLKQLQGDHHSVLTGVSLVNSKRTKTALATADVAFRKIETDELERYWQSGEPLDKAGSYGIQGLGAIFIAGICGQPSTVAGLPLVETNQLLAEFGVNVWQHRIDGQPEPNNR